MFDVCSQGCLLAEMFPTFLIPCTAPPKTHPHTLLSSPSSSRGSPGLQSPPFPAAFLPACSTGLPGKQRSRVQCPPRLPCPALALPQSSDDAQRCRSHFTLFGNPPPARGWDRISHKQPVLGASSYLGKEKGGSSSSPAHFSCQWPDFLVQSWFQRQGNTGAALLGEQSVSPVQQNFLRRFPSDTTDQ